MSDLLSHGENTGCVTFPVFFSPIADNLGSIYQDVYKEFLCPHI